MIPTEQAILEDLLAERITLDQAVEQIRAWAERMYGKE